MESNNEQLTSLPKYWHIKRNYENYKIINNYMNNFYKTDKFFMPNDFVNNKNHNSGFGTKGNTIEITFKQFEMWVLNKSKIYELW